MSEHPSTAGARSLILGRISDILGTRTATAEEGQAAIPRDYTSAPSLDRDACLALLTDRLLHYQVVVHHCERATLPKTIAAALSARGKARLHVPPDIDTAWLPAGHEFVPDSGLSSADLDRSEGVLTGCSFAIANTGTIVLRHGPGEGRRALTLIPDYHVCVVFAAQVVQTVPEAMRRLAVLGPRLVTTISGPSATADIEMTRIRGVHGPRTLDVILGR
jgi:L-lactate dehydrogenase complex protein LldG